MSRILLLTNSQGASAEVLPALGLLQHQIRILPALASVLVDTPEVDCVFLDARDRKSTRLNSSHVSESRMPSSA